MAINEIFNANVNHRLTISPEGSRVTIKYAIGSDQSEIERVRKFFMDLFDQIGFQERTIRGKLPIAGQVIKMYYDNREHFRSIRNKGN
jgi:hypothetical protein